ncbi:CsbD family protein [Devosia sp. A369]
MTNTGNVIGGWRNDCSAGPLLVCNLEELPMHKDEVKGVGKQVKGAVKDAVGGLTGNEKLQAEGKLDKAAGKIQQKVGEVKDAGRDALKR